MLGFTTFLLGNIYEKEKFSYVFLIFFLVLLLFQWKTTTPQSLTILDNDEQRIRTERIKYYAPSEHYVRVAFKRLDLVNFLEGDFNTASKRVQRNFFETIDPNIYFFGGHPRERVWANDFEKFAYIFAIPFFIGLYNLIILKKWLFFYGLIICIVLLSIIGHKNQFGPFILFPFIVTSITSGLFILLDKIKGRSLILVLILSFLSIVQTFIYAY